MEFDKQIQLKQNVVWDFGIELKLDWISVVKMDQSIEMQNSGTYYGRMPILFYNHDNTFIIW